MRSTFTLPLFLLPLVLSSQSLSPTSEFTVPPVNKIHTQQALNNQAVLWSENFSNGIPINWLNSGSDSAALWEYRGPTTTPDNSVGSRGAYNGKQGPITSASANNGFVIFDSDYLDTRGSPTSWIGFSPVPHTGTLQTNIIDLSGEPNVELVFTSFARRYSSRFYVAFSTDGGSTFPDTLEYFNLNQIYINQATSTSEFTYKNVSSIIGGQSQVVLKFIFDGSQTLANTTIEGYYFWMLDDIAIRRIPANALKLVDRQFHPQEGITYNDSLNYGPYGILHIDQVVPMKFHANITNYGINTQSKVSLLTEVWNLDSNSLVFSVSSPTCATLLQNDTCFENTLSTINWIPSQPGNYAIVYKAVSDSIPASSSLQTDTFLQIISDSLYARDRGMVNNYVGTSSQFYQTSKLAVKYSFTNEDPDSAGSGMVYLQGAAIGFHPGSDSTGLITLALYDTANYPQNPGNPLLQKTFTLGPVNSKGTNHYYFAKGKALAIPVGDYYLELNLSPQQVIGGTILLNNDASVKNVAGNAMLMLNNGNWLKAPLQGVLHSPWMRIIMHHQATSSISTKEITSDPFEIYPNPSEDYLYISFKKSGIYKLRFYTLSGEMVKEYKVRAGASQLISINHSGLLANFYMLQIDGEKHSRTVKLRVK